jgi:uncharacterized damage-inducible protein DinB
MKDLLVPLFGHMRWADGLVAAALQRDAVTDSDALRLFAHVLGTEHLWYARIHGHTPRLAVWPSLTASECVDLARENADAFDALLAGLDEDALQRVVHYRNSAGREFDNTVGDILTHVAMHGSYHRGQIAREMRRAGREPVYTDYIGYARRDQ